MAHRRCLSSLTCRATALISSKSPFSSLNPPLIPTAPSLKSIFSVPHYISPTLFFNRFDIHHFSSDIPKGSDCDDEEGEDEDDDDTDVENQGGSSDEESYLGSHLRKEYTPEEKEAEAAAIGYKVIGPLERSDRVFKPYEQAFAVVQIGSHQFKVSNGDCIFTERLKLCEVNDKLILNKVLLLGSISETIVGRPVVPDAAVHAVVEEHALDAKVIIFKKKRRKNYRRTKGHRQELTKLRITDIQGIEKPDTSEASTPSKAAIKKSEKVAVAG